MSKLSVSNAQGRDVETLPTGTALAQRVATTPATMFTDAKVAEGLFSEIEEEVNTALAALDLSTAKGRGTIASLAYKVAQTKAAVDDAGKALGEDARKALDKINSERRVFKERFQGLQDRAREPLTQWEAADAARQVRVSGVLQDLRDSAVVAMGETAAAVRARYQRIAGLVLEEAEFQTDLKLAEELKRYAMGALEAGYAGLVKAEADAAELRRLRETDEARQRKEREDAEAAAAEERRQQEEATRAQREAEEAYYRDWAAAEAEEAGRQRAIAAAAAAEERRKQQDAAIAAELERQENARKADETHRAQVQYEAVQAVMASGDIGMARAERIVASIVAGNVPHVKLEF